MEEEYVLSMLSLRSLTDTRHLGELSINQLNGSLEFGRNEGENINWVVMGTQMHS